MSDFFEIAREFGPWAAMLFMMLVFLGSLLYYFKTKIDAWGEPWVQSQIKLTNSLKESTELNAKSQASNAESQASQAVSLAKTTVLLGEIKDSTDAQVQANKLTAIGLSQLIDESKGVSKDQVEALEFRFRKLEEQVLQQDVADGRELAERAESFQDPRLKMKPMHDEEAKNLQIEIEDLKDDLSEEPEEEPKP